MNFTVISVFPEMFVSPLGCSILKRAQEKQLLSVRFLNPREFTKDRHRVQVAWENLFWFKEGGDLYVVEGEEKEHLIPATREFIEKVDIPNQRIIVDLPVGLLAL